MRRGAIVYTRRRIVISIRTKEKKKEKERKKHPLKERRRLENT